MDIRHRLWVEKTRKKAKKIEAMRLSLEEKSDEDLLNMSMEMKEKISSSKDPVRELDRYVEKAYSLAAEASRRTTGMTPYEVQVIAALGIHEGKVVEQKTGEGKTLTVSMPSYLHALTGKGVHVVTVNPYLCKRDAENIGRIHEFLGLTCGYILPNMTTNERQKNYGCDITYVSNSEVGFDYLRDNMAKTVDSLVLRDLEFAIVDEIDSILIDEAKVPLIISSQGRDYSKLFMVIEELVSSLTRGKESKRFNANEALIDDEDEARTESGDYVVNEKDQMVVLTEAGVKKIESRLKLDNYSDEKNYLIQHIVYQSLVAHVFKEKDKDYIVKDGKVQLVGSFTGRVSKGRKYSDGLHQAIEAKEHVEITPISSVAATITYQNFFRKYRLLSGMTGTGVSEEKEFKSIYGLDVVPIPTNRPVIREDNEPLIFFNKNAKYSAILKKIKEATEKGQPVLAGTASVEESQNLSRLLKKNGISHQVLNAKQDKREADIVAEAGKAGTVTVATNMAGRGTDIKLDDEAKKAGGLVVIGTEKQDSVRIDNQLRGRSGRQGDPGESHFYCALDDRLMRLKGSDKIEGFAEKFIDDKSLPITDKSVHRALRYSQESTALDNFAARKDTLEYDDINDFQRNDFYRERREVLFNDNLDEKINECFKNAVDHYVDRMDVKELSKFFTTEVAVSFSESELSKYKGKSLKKFIYQALLDEKDSIIYPCAKAKEEYERKCLLMVFDAAWSEQIKALDFLRTSLHYVGYGQLNPKSIYAEEAYKAYDKMKEQIYLAVLNTFFNTRPDIGSYTINY